MSTQITEAKYIWKDGSLVSWKDATVHVLATAVQFGTSVFEGIRCYETEKGPAVFRLHAHIQRLVESARIYRMLPSFDAQTLAEACLEVVRQNGLSSCYVRPMILRGYGSAGLNPVASPIETWIPAFSWGTYLGAGALEKGVAVCVSSWHRAAPNTFPMAAKAGGNYINAQLIKMEALENGYAEGIALGPSGLVSEGSGQNLFFVRDGVLITPILDGTSLRGITRHSIIVLAREMGLEVREQLVPREALYAAEEMFFTGTAAEVTPITSVDRIPIGGGTAGPITLQLQRRFLDIAMGRAEDRWDWLTMVR
ncbi:MAG: branched-chain amino acid transaminase [Gemmatimonadota bacterium]